MGGIDRFDDIDTVVDMVSLIPGVTFHRVRVVASAEGLEHEGHVFLGGVVDYLGKAAHTLGGTVGEGNLRSVGLGRVLGSEPREYDHVGTAVVGGGVDAGFGLPNEPRVMIEIVEPVDERRVGRHIETEEGAGEAVFFDDLEFIDGVEEFDAAAAEFLGDLTDSIETPLIAANVKTPVGDGLFQ